MGSSDHGARGHYAPGGAASVPQVFKSSVRSRQGCFSGGLVAAIHGWEHLSGHLYTGRAD